MLILKAGFEDSVRSLFGVDEDDLPDADLNRPLVLDLAEAVSVKRVPAYKSITDTIDLLYLQNAVISYIGYIIAPSMSRRLNTKVATLDTRWEKKSVDWEDFAKNCLTEFENSISSISSVEVMYTTTAPLGITLVQTEKYI